MIEIKDKRNCCGCTACSQICPKHCISMQEDREGFKYPKADSAVCNGCGLCEKVCPYTNAYPIPVEKPASFACKTKDDGLRKKSSSGGLFTVLASKIIKDGGVVFGAKFDDGWNVVHGCTETLEGLSAFRGSKYVQSDLGDSFKRVRDFLNGGRRVMFTGTPCQVAGLNHYLQKRYDGLVTVDFVCHCVPSPLVWKNYLDELSGGRIIKSVSFRDKSEGWAKFGLAVAGETAVLTRGNHRDNIYMKAFLSNLIVRPGCTNCPARSYRSGADITIADCWGFNEFHPELNDDKGMSLALILTGKGAALYQEAESQMDSLRIPYVEVQEESNHNPIIRPPKYHKYRNCFFNEFIKGNKGTIELMEKYIQKGENRERRIASAKAVVRGLMGEKLINSFKSR